MKMFVKKIFNFITQATGDGLEMSLGTDTQDDALILSTTFPTGALGFDDEYVFAPTVSTGLDTQLDSFNLFAALIEIGVDTEDDVASAAILATFPNGSETSDEAGADLLLPNLQDTSGNSRHLTALGTNSPKATNYPLAGFIFDGVDLNDSSAGLSAGVTGFGVSTSDGSFKLVGTIRRGRTGATEIIFGKTSDGPIAERNYQLFIRNTTGFLEFRVTRNDGTEITAVGTTSLLANTNYLVEAEWTGSVLQIKVNGVAEGTTPAITALQAPDATTPFMIGRKRFNAGDAASPYPFQGTISNVQMYRGGVLQGSWLTPVNNPINVSAEITTPSGIESGSLVVNVTADLEDYSSGSADNGGSQAWTNPSNADGAYNGTEASWTLAAGLSPVSENGDMLTAGLVIPSTPAGFTRGNVYIGIRHRWDVAITSPLIDTARIWANLLTSTLTDLGIIFERNDGGTVIGGNPSDTTTRAALATDLIDVTSIIGANTTFTVSLRTTGSLSLPTSGNMAWQVDAVHIVVTFTQTGIT